MKTKINYMPEFYERHYDYVATDHNGDQWVMYSKTEPVKTVTAMNTYNDKVDELEIIFYLPAIMKVKKPYGIIKLAETINRLFLTEFLCGFVRVENEKYHPECANPCDMNGSGKMVGSIFDCPFIDIDIGDLT